MAYSDLPYNGNYPPGVTDNDPYFTDESEVNEDPLCLGCHDDCDLDSDGYCPECVDEDDGDL